MKADRRYYVLCALLMLGAVACALGPVVVRSARIAWSLRQLRSEDPERRKSALVALRVHVREGLLPPHRVAHAIEDNDPLVSEATAQVLMDSGDLRALSSAALARPDEFRSFPVPRPAAPAPVPLATPQAPIIIRCGPIAVGREDKWMVPALLSETPDFEKLRKVVTSVGKGGYGFARPSFSCAKRFCPVESSLTRGFFKAPHPDARLLAQTVLAVHHSCVRVNEQVKAAAALPPPAPDDPAAPAVRFLKGEAFSPPRVLAALRSGDERLRCWGLLVACERPRPEYRTIVEALIPYDDEKRPLNSVGILAARALGHIGEAKSAELLRRTALEGNYYQRAAAITALGRLRDFDPVPTCLTVISRPPKSVGDWTAACRVLGERGGAGAIPALEALLRKDLRKVCVDWAAKKLRSDIRGALAAIRKRQRSARAAETPRGESCSRPTPPRGPASPAGE